MSELDKAKQWLEEDIEWMKENECEHVHASITLDEANSLLNSLNLIEQLRDKLNKDINEVRYKSPNECISMVEVIKGNYAQEILEIIGGYYGCRRTKRRNSKYFRK